jgi:hypothetical protein
MSNEPENPRPVRLLGQLQVPAEPPFESERPTPAVVDADTDRFGAEAAVARLDARILALEPHRAVRFEDGRAVLAPTFAPARDRTDGYTTGVATLVVFGAFATPWSRPLGAVLAHVRDRHKTTVRVVWRHYPDPAAHHNATTFALAAEAAALRGRFWVLTRKLLALKHHDPKDLHHAMVRAGLDPARTIDEMRAPSVGDRIVEDVQSAQASGVTYSPALFIDGRRYAGDLDPGAVADALARPTVA